MARKFTVTDPQIGGAKAGIRFDHRDPRAREVLRRFIRANEQLLRSSWVTAGDLNTDDLFIERVIQEDLGLPSCQWRLASRIAECPGGADRSAALSEACKLPCFAEVEYQGRRGVARMPLIEASVGCVLAETIRRALQLAGVASTAAEGAALPRVVVQGAGAVGTGVCYWLERERIARVVAVADKDGYVLDRTGRGLSMLALLDARDRRRAQLEQAGANASTLAECNKNLLCNLMPAHEPSLQTESYVCRRRTQAAGARGDREYLLEFIQALPAEDTAPLVFSACSTRYQVDAAVVEALCRRGMRVMANGANNCFGRVSAAGTLEEDRSGAVERLLRDRGVVVVPDWVANSGTAQLFHRVLSCEFDWRARGVEQRVIEACTAATLAFLNEAALACADGDYTLLLAACERLARNRIAQPRPLAQTISPSAALVRTSASPYARSMYALPALLEAQQLPLAERLRRTLAVGCECVERTELEAMLRACPNPVAYDGFEPSGRMHIAQGLLKAVNVNRMTSAGFTYVFWLADIFSVLNHKMGGDLERIRVVGRYFIEVWRAAGMDLSRVRFLWAGEEIERRSAQYWALVLDISRRFTLTRVRRAVDALGRSEKDDALSTSSLLYACMQCADVFFLGVDVCQLGLDQRKVNMLAREYTEHAPDYAGTKPVVLSHTMVPGLKQGQAKMSKSQPDSAIFMEDSREDVERKIRGAYCPPGSTLADVDNPVLAYYRQFVFNAPHTADGYAAAPVTLQRDAQNGGAVTFACYAEFLITYQSGALHPNDVKTNLARLLNDALEPVRAHFRANAEARALLEQVRSFQVTR